MEVARIALDASYTLGRFPTGSATYSRRLIETLAELGAGHELILGYRVSRFRKRREFLHPAGATVKFITPWLAWRTDLFHCLGQRPAPFRFKREVVTIHDIFPITRREYSSPEYQRRFSELLRRAIARADCILTGSQSTSAQLQGTCGVAPERIRVIPYGVDLPDHVLSGEERVRERARWAGEGNQMLLSVGMLEVRKNILNSLRALRMLPGRYHLVLAGGDGYGSAPVHAFIREQKLENRVRVLGYVREEALAALYQSATTLVFPSFDEGFGFPVLEAMACGLPVVTSKTSSLPEVCGHAALYVDPTDPEEIAARVLQSVENAELRESLIDKGYARAREFPWRRTAERTLKVYEELLPQAL